MISIVIVNWNSGELLEKCVRSLQRHAEGCEIVIVDNASTDGSLRFVSGIESDVTVLNNDENLGFAAGCNVGWKAGKGAHILFLNPDTECLPESIRCLEQTLLKDRSVWAVGGQLVSPSGLPQTSFNVRTFPTVGKVAAEMLFIDEIRAAVGRRRPKGRNDSATAIDVDQPAAACLMVSGNALEYVGGFDEGFYPAWFEDVDFCRRIRDHGGRILYQPGARFLHHGGYSLHHMARQDFLECFHRNQLRYFRKHHGSHVASRVKRLIVLGMFLRSVISTIYPLVPGNSRKSSARIFLRAGKHIRDWREAEL